jgi:hypothetical protein
MHIWVFDAVATAHVDAASLEWRDIENTAENGLHCQLSSQTEPTHAVSIHHSHCHHTAGQDWVATAKLGTLVKSCHTSSRGNSATTKREETELRDSESLLTSAPHQEHFQRSDRALSKQFPSSS